MAVNLQNLDQRFPIVDPETGQPTDYFMRLLRNQTGALADASDGLENDINTLINRNIDTGFGLSGGGDLSADRTISLGNPALVDPNADRILFWDDSAGELKWLTPGTGLTITDTTINASGGGGGNWWFQPPLASSFTLLSAAGTPNVVLTDDADVGLLMDATIGANGIRVALRTLTDKTQDWQLTARMNVLHAGVTPGGLFGLIARDSITGRFSTNYITSNQGYASDRWNSFTSYNSTPALRNSFRLGMTGEAPWFRIEKVGGNLFYRLSPNGKLWMTLYTEIETAWLTNRADQVGLIIARNSAEAISIQGDCTYFNLVGPGV